MNTIYTSGPYLESTPTWHSEDSPWKAAQISKIISQNKIQLSRIAEIGCGAGAVLEELSKRDDFCRAQFKGYDISPQAIELAKRRESTRIQFACEDLLSKNNTEHFDALLAIDVYEHVPDYMGFLTNCRMKANYKIYHIPLDLHVSSVLRNAFINNRYTLGHLHYFTADSAIATLKDTGHEVLDYFYTNAATELFWQHPSIKKAIANVPRLIYSKLNLPFAARIFGGYSLLVLAK
jgi:SAM-dependent methyltransferase